MFLKLLQKCYTVLYLREVKDFKLGLPEAMGLGPSREEGLHDIDHLEIILSGFEIVRISLRFRI